MMRVKIASPDRGDIPVNMYAINLASSGHGKGHSMNIMEEQVINRFRETFLEHTFPFVAKTHLTSLAIKRSTKRNAATGEPADPDAELKKVEKEFERLGPLAFSFDSATTAAVKQMRHKLLMADAGSVNMEIDEIGSNLLGQVDVLTTFLELFDMGKIKQKLVKNTNENERSEEIHGKTPTNALLFGTPAKLLNGGKIEEEFYSMLETGYARRCIFGFAKGKNKKAQMTPEEVYNMMTDTSSEVFLDQLSQDLEVLANPNNFNQTLKVDKDVALALIEYRLKCEAEADKMPEHAEIRKAELAHRYFKAMKLAGAYAFIEGNSEVTMDNLVNAIALVEESGEAFDRLLTRDRNYVKLARYIAESDKEVTHVDLTEDLPFYKGSEAQKRDLMGLATAWGYKNHIVIKKHFTDGIEFFKGEALKATNLDNMLIAYSTDWVKDYLNETRPWKDLHKVMQASGYHWVSHHLLDNYRKEENAIPGFNMIVLDIDSGVSLATAQMLLKDITCMFYTTKRHTEDYNRFRVVIPMNYHLKLDPKDYKEFMSNIYDWLPFDVDTATAQRARKWESFNGKYIYNDAELLDVLPFIPRTSKNEERKKVADTYQNLSNIERWFVNNIGVGNRSNQLIKYALMLVDMGKDFAEVTSLVSALNDKIQDKLDPSELQNTIFVSVAKAIQQKSVNP